MSLFTPDGNVVSSSQTEAEEWLKGQSMPILLGIVLSVRVSDDERNYSAQNKEDNRGNRHECVVLATDYLGKQPDLLIPNVIIPPSRHSGIDNFEEDLPRGCSSTVDGSEYNDNFTNIDYSLLDGEWCLVGFVGGNIESPFIIGWWPHPSNVFDPATSGQGNDGSSLAQFEEKKNKSRFVRRINGSTILVNREGSLYLDTSEANSTVKVTNGKLTRTLVDKGGHIQVDISQKAQFELNWNEKEHRNPRLGAGSTSASPQTDVDLPHNDQPVSGQPKPRETTRTFIRGKEYELLFKTSNLSVFCEDGDQDGELVVQAQTGVTIAQQPSGGTAATISIRDGQIQVVGSDGSQVNVLPDEIQIVTASGGLLDLNAQNLTVAAQVDVSGPLAVGGATGQPVVNGTTKLAAEALWVNPLAEYFKNVAPVWTAIAAIPGGQAAAPMAAAATSLAAILEIYGAAIAQPSATNLFTTKNLTSS